MRMTTRVDGVQYHIVHNRGNWLVVGYTDDVLFPMRDTVSSFDEAIRTIGRFALARMDRRIAVNSQRVCENTLHLI